MKRIQLIEDVELLVKLLGTNGFDQSHLTDDQLLKAINSDDATEQSDMAKRGSEIAKNIHNNRVKNIQNAELLVKLLEMNGFNQSQLTDSQLSIAIEQGSEIAKNIQANRVKEKNETVSEIPSINEQSPFKRVITHPSVIALLFTTVLSIIAAALIVTGTVAIPFLMTLAPIAFYGVTFTPSLSLLFLDTLVITWRARHLDEAVA